MTESNGVKKIGKLKWRQLFDTSMKSVATESDERLPAPRLVGRNVASPTILNFVPQILDVT